MNKTPTNQIEGCATAHPIDQTRSGTGTQREPTKYTGDSDGNIISRGPIQLTCERCGNKTDAGAWIGFVYVGAECLTNDDSQYLD